MDRLRGASRAQQRCDDDMDLRLPTSKDELAARVLCGRCQDGDPHRYFGGVMGRAASELRCPFGCLHRGEPAAFTWWHVQFCCAGGELPRLRREWLEKLRVAAGAATDAQRGVPHRGLRRLVGAGEAGEGWAIGVAYASDEEVEMRRLVGGCVSKLAAGSSDRSGVTALVRSATVAGLELQEAGVEATREWRERHREEADRARSAKKWVEKWKAALFRGGPRRAAALREASLAFERVVGVAEAAAGSGELPAEDLVEVRRAAEAARAAEWRRAKQLAARNWLVAYKLWNWLRLVRRWRATARIRAARRTGEDGDRAVDVPDGEAVGAIAASAGVLRLTAGRWRWLTHGDEVRLPEGPDGRLVTGPGLGARVAMARRRMRWCGPRASLLRLSRWEIAEGRAESSNHRWAVEALLSVRRPEVRRGRQLWVTVRWAGTNPLFECPWPDSELPIGDLTRDLRACARDMERVKYPYVEATRPAPLRVLGKRGAGEGRGDFLGSRWDSGGDSADGARDSRRRP